DGTISYTHDGSETTSDSFTYTIADADGNVSAPITVNIGVNAVDDTAPSAPTVKIVDDNNPDDLVLTQEEINGDGVQIQVLIDHDELVQGGHIKLTVTNGTVSSDYLLSLDENGNLVIELLDGTQSSVEFSYNSDTGIISWTELTPDEGQQIAVKASQVDANNNESDSSTDIAVVETVASIPTLTLSESVSITSVDFENITVGDRGFNSNVDVKDLDPNEDWGTHNANNRLEVGNASTYGAKGGENHVLELEGAGESDNTLYLDVDLVAGMQYQFEFDTAARNAKGGGDVPKEQSSNFTVKLINIDTREEQVLHNVDFSDVAVWDHIQSILTVDTSGRYRIEFEAVNANTYGALLDNISLKTAVNQGYEDSFIKLSDIDVSTANSGSETLSVQLTGLPVGTKIKGFNKEDGKEYTLEAAENGIIIIPSSWDPSTLYINIADTGRYDVNVIAIATELNGTTQSVTETITIEVYNPESQFDILSANTQNFLTNASGTIEIPEAWLLHSDLSPEGTDVDAVSGAEFHNGILTVSQGNDFEYTIGANNQQSTANVSVTQSNSNTIIGTAGNDIIIADANKGSVTFKGEQGEDVLVGGNSNDKLEGQGGQDLLIGGNGNDTLDGGFGSDILIGGLGDDALIGGLGKAVDTFTWQQGDVGKDTIADFQLNFDKLDLSDLLQGESLTSLENFLSFNLVGDSTVIEINVDGQGNDVNQQIVLAGVDITQNNVLTDAEIIQNLLGENGDGPLIVDTESSLNSVQGAAQSSGSVDDELRSIISIDGNHIP
ncbi:MAG: type I secretion C-terminal target domain-containing protein, partial [Shewanella sp.]|nr:type I secretion C-terminal target domain-containing protein [Shewanella sp.]